MCKFSIIMTSYNHENYIWSAIESIMSQSFSGWELYIGDDGSIDGTHKVLEQYKNHSQIHIFHHEFNLGITANIDFLLSKVSRDAEYIAFLESDDIWDSYMLQQKLDIFEKNPAIALVYNECDIIDENSLVIQRRALENLGWKYIQNTTINASYFLGKVHYLSYSSLAFRREIMEQYGILSIDWVKNFWASDWDIFFRIATENLVYCIQDSLTLYRKHSSNVSGDIRVDIRNMMLIFVHYKDSDSKRFDILYSQCSSVRKIFITVYILIPEFLRNWLRNSIFFIWKIHG
jgi:glycosyltransferase involved in cell wall biosynthesis